MFVGEGGVEVVLGGRIPHGVLTVVARHSAINMFGWMSISDKQLFMKHEQVY